jgi:RimJ/RimL family protein N-acetyltransferase
VVSDLAVRPFAPDDSSHLLEWYRDDREGLEALMGEALPDVSDCAAGFQALLGQVNEGLAMLAVVTHREAPIGLAALTGVAPDRSSGSPHLYIVPNHRRYSVAAAKKAEGYARSAGVRAFVTTINQENTRAMSLAKRMGYELMPRITLKKELA